MNKLGEYDAKKLREAKKLIEEVAEYNYTSDSDSLCRKLNTIISKLDNILNNELQEECKPVREENTRDKDFEEPEADDIERE